MGSAQWRSSRIKVSEPLDATRRRKSAIASNSWYRSVASSLASGGGAQRRSVRRGAMRWSSPPHRSQCSRRTCERHVLDQRGEDAAEGLQRDRGSLGAAAVHDDVAALLVLRPGERREQRGLPDPRLAAEQRRPQRTRPGRDQVGLQPGHLALSSDESRRLGQLAGEGHLDDRATFRGRERSWRGAGIGGIVVADPPAATRRSIERTRADGSVPISSARKLRYAW